MKTVMYRTGRMPLLLKIAIGFFLGILFGFIAAPMMPYSPVLSDHIMPFLELAGKLFLRVLSVIIIPLVFSSLVSGIASIGDTKKLGRIGLKTFAIFVLTSIAAAGIGMFCAELFKPGVNITIPVNLHKYSDAPKPIRDALLSIFSSSPAAKVLHNEVLYVIIFALLAGVICMFLGNTGKKISGFFSKLEGIMQRLTYTVMNFAPYGVFALIATAAADFGLSLIVPFATIIAAVYSGCIVHGLVVYSLMIMLLCMRSPVWFFKGIYEAAATAFVTRSSSITLPVTLDNVRDNFGVSEEISSFVLPLGATMNMDGTAIYQVICAIFVARAYNVPITFGLQASIFMATVLASIGTVGVPSAGLIMLTMVLTSAGLPVEGVGLVAGIDVVLCSARTSLNVMGDAAVCAVVAASEGEHLTENNSRGRMQPVNYGA